MRDLPYLATRLFDTPHLVRRGKLDTILSAVGPRLIRGDATPSRKMQGRNVIDQREALRFDNRGVAVIPIVGTLVRRGSWLDAESGLMSYSAIADVIGGAMLDPDVRAVLLDIDSPGGEAGGCFDLADFIRQAARQTRKPVWAVANECAASAAYAIACGASQIWVPRTGEVGSVGVVAAHLDRSGADHRAGLKWSYVFAGERKVAGNPHEPLDDETRASVQSDVNDLYRMFVGLVASARSMTPAAVRATRAEMFRGKNAVRAGLADRVGTLEEAFAVMSAKYAS